MARYQKPEDPRESGDKRPRQFRQDGREPIPWAWLGAGVLITIIGIFGAVALANSLLARPPLEEIAIEPNIIILTAPPADPPTSTPVLPTPSPIPTFTPIPTPNNAVAPSEVSVGFYAAVANTDGAGVNVRGGPSTNNVILFIADEGAVFLVTSGPQSAEDLIWWEVELDDGTMGWIVAQFLEPAAAP